MSHHKISSHKINEKEDVVSLSDSQAAWLTDKTMTYSVAAA